MQYIILLIYIGMSSIESINSLRDASSEDQSPKPQTKKAKAMAHKYIRFQKSKLEQQQKRNKHLKCVIKVLGALHKKCSVLWQKIIPLRSRGYMTPFQSIYELASNQSKQYLLNTPFSKQTLTECISQQNHAVLVTFTQRSINETVKAIDNNKNISMISRSKIPILPFKVQGQTLNIEERRVYEIISTNQQQQLHQLVLVVKKGLFDEIIVLDFYDLFDPRLYENVLKSIDNREVYEAEVITIANHEKKLEETCMALTEKSTNSTNSETEKN